MNSVSTVHRLELAALRCLDVGLLLFWAVWAGALCLAGVWMWVHGNRLCYMLAGWLGTDAPAVAPLVYWGRVAAIAGGEFIFMYQVADDLCPDAPMVVSKVPEVFMATLTLGSLARAAWLLKGLMW